MSLSMASNSSLNSTRRIEWRVATPYAPRGDRPPTRPAGGSAAERRHLQFEMSPLRGSKLLPTCNPTLTRWGYVDIAAPRLWRRSSPRLHLWLRQPYPQLLQLLLIHRRRRFAQQVLRARGLRE